MPPLLVAHQVSKSYVAGFGRCWARVHVLRDLSLSIAGGERVVVTGAPGAGKTTLLHCLTGLRRPEGGSVRWHSPSRVPYRLCSEPWEVTTDTASLVVVDLPGNPWEAGQWMESLHAAPLGQGWLVFARRPGPLAELGDRSLELRDGHLHELPIRRAWRVAER